MIFCSVSVFGANANSMNRPEIENELANGNQQQVERPASLLKDQALAGERYPNSDRPVELRLNFCPTTGESVISRRTVWK
jgi:hypothetical protein